VNRSNPLLALLAAVLLAGSVPLTHAEAKRPAVKPARPTAPAAARRDTTARPHRVIAYYFHTNSRCVNCRRIEAYSREAMETAFSRELEDGRLVWRVVNVEEEGHKHFVNDYQLATKSLVLVDEVAGKQARWKNCTKVWQFLSDKDGFLRYVQAEVRGYLTEKS
jgi:hypothetical protein